jgi:cell division protein FtsX
MGKKLNFAGKVMIVGIVITLLLYSLGWFGYTLLNDVLTDLYNFLFNYIPNKYLISIIGISICIGILVLLGVSFKKIRNKMPF